MPSKHKLFNLRAWLDNHGLTTQQLTDYLNEIGFSLSRRTVEDWLTVAGKPPKWLAPVLRQRDALNALYAEFGPLHDAVIGACATIAHGRGKGQSTVADYCNEAAEYCDNIEGLFGQHLTERERGELPDEEFCRQVGIPIDGRRVEL